MNHQKLRGFVLFVVFLSCVQFTFSQTIINDYAFDATVRDIKTDGLGRTFVGGDFLHVGFHSSSGAKFDLNTQVWDDSFVKLNHNSSIFSVVAIPGGGWYIGGNFTAVDGVVRTSLARINADGTLHSFNPVLNGSVHSMVLDQSNNLYIAGLFTNVNGSTRSYFAQLDASGNLTAFDPDFNGIVNTLELDAAGNLYCGGSFTTVGVTPRTHFAKFDNTGTLTSFDPAPNYGITDFAISSNQDLFMVGTFTEVSGGTLRNGLAAYDVSGVLLPVSIDPDQPIRTIEFDSNDNFYIGGNFTDLGGVARNYFAKYDYAGTLSSFNPDFSGYVRTIAVDNSDQVYVGGNFDLVNGVEQNQFALFDASGNLSSFTVSTNHDIYAIALDGSGGMYVGGSFHLVKSKFQRNLVCFNPDGSLNNFNANISTGTTTVNSIEFDASNNIYIGGKFGTVQGVTRNSFAKLDPSGNLLSLDPQIWPTGGGSNVNSIHLDDAGNLYIGGNFLGVDGGLTLRNRVVKYDAFENLTAFDPNIGVAADEVYSIVTDDLGYVYIGGKFNAVLGGTTTRNNFVRFDNTGVITSFDPNFNERVITLLLDASGNLFAGGLFTTVGGSTSRNYIAGFDATGTLTPFNPGPDNMVRDMVLDPSGNLYISGYFNQIGVTPRELIAAFDTGGNLLPLSLDIDGILNNVVAINFDDSEILHYGGSFINPNLRYSKYGVCQPPAILNDAQDQTTCSGNSVDFGIFAIGSSLTYQWQFNGVDIAGANTPTITLTGLDAADEGTYSCIVSNGCGADTSALAQFTLTELVAGMNLSGSFFEASPAGGTYQWINCRDGSVIAGETDDKFDPLIPGNYAVVVTLNGCTDTSDCAQFLGTPVTQHSGNIVALYPNPNNGIFAVDLNTSATVEIFNQVGEVVATYRFDSGNNLVDLQNLSSGLYVMRVMDAAGFVSSEIFSIVHFD